jgi:membrane protease subunit HflC
MRGTGEAEATGIYATAFGQDSQFYALLRNPQAYEKILNSDSTLVLSSDSDLFRHLNSHRDKESGARAIP